MTVKEFLSKIHAVDKRINNKLDQIEGLRSLLERVTPVLTGMPRGGQKDTSNIVDRIWRLEAAVTDDIDLFVDMVQETRKAIERMDSEFEKYILEARYLVYWSWDKIAEDYGVSVDTIHRAHGRALQNIKIKLDLQY